MKLTRTLEVTEKEFYDYLEQDLIEKIFKTTGKQIKPAAIKKGLKYTLRPEDPMTRINVTIKSYERNQHYHAIIESYSETIVLRYETQRVPQGLDVTLTQSIESFESQKHNKLMQMFSEAVYLGRMTDMLYDIQSKIVKNRELLEEQAQDLVATRK